MRPIKWRCSTASVEKAISALVNADSTRERILDTTVELLRRHGLGKTGVVDVARALDMSHSNVYKHFTSKSALFDAVAERWLAQVMAPLTKITADKKAPAAKRLKQWTRTLAEVKRKKVLGDPALFEVYNSITADAHDVVAAHVARMRDEVAEILRDGVRSGAWKLRSPGATAMLILNATARFHHPAMVGLDEGRTDLAELDALMDVVIAGLSN
ncbi:MAG: TetR family transcriptional regulator [Phycisphaerales bacterium]|nr:TetR family transcriptional regulator [Hyphomonadaceae bacterium]